MTTETPWWVICDFPEPRPTQADLDRLDAERYRKLCANPNWAFVERLCRQFAAENSSEFKAGLDRALDVVEFDAFGQATPAEPENTPPQRLLDLADRIDHEKLWRRPGLDRPDMTREQKDRLDAGVYLRRYADLLGSGGWRLFPPRPGFSYRAGSLDKVIEMARRDEEREQLPLRQPATGC